MPKLAPSILSIAVLGSLGLLAAHDRPSVVLLAAAAVLAVGVIAAEPLLPVVAVVPGCLAVARLGSGGAGSSLSVSDGILAIGALFALSALAWRDASKLRLISVAASGYLALLVFSVVVQPNRYDIQEWFHRLLMLEGGLVVGWVLAARDKVRAALGSYLVLSGVLAAVTCVAAVRLHLQPVSLPLGLQKNFIGGALAVAVLIAHVNPSWTGLSRHWVRPIKYLFLLGMLASQSRQAIIGLILSMMVVVVRSRTRLGRRSKILLLALVPLGVVATLTVEAQLATGNEHDSINQRFTWFHQALALWRTSPVFGVGLHFFNTGHFALQSQPPNAEIEELASAGIVGLLGLVILAVAAMAIVWRLPPSIGTLGVAVLTYHLVQGQLDIFWVTATGTIPWVVVGMCLGRADVEASATLRAGAARSPGMAPPAALLGTGAGP